MGWAVLGLASSTGRQKKRSILRPRASLSGGLGQGGRFHSSAVGFAAGVQAGDVPLQSLDILPSLAALLAAFERAESAPMTRSATDSRTLRPASRRTGDTLHARYASPPRR